MWLLNLNREWKITKWQGNLQCMIIVNLCDQWAFLLFSKANRNPLQTRSPDDRQESMSSWCICMGLPSWWPILTHWGQGKMAAFLQMTFSSAFSWMKNFVCFVIKISLKFVVKYPINNKTALVQIMAWLRSGDKPLSEPMVVYLIDAYVSLSLNELMSIHATHLKIRHP